MKKREKTEYIVLNYYASPLDFKVELQFMQDSIEKHRKEVELADKYGIAFESDPLPGLLANSCTLKDILRGFFDILVIVEGKGINGGDDAT